ncbi:MAG TPA: hypothetical protein VM901_00170 [Bdellovibrionota bacterium]|jgi:hypothetical protein|nr:hypothetical protein [Bdellovibrionota bacterium]
MPRDKKASFIQILAALLSLSLSQNSYAVFADPSTASRVPLLPFNQNEAGRPNLKPKNLSANQNTAIYQRWLKATIKSLDCMREKDGLIADAVTIDPTSTAECPIKVLNHTTSPTNIGFDLLILFQQDSPLLSKTLEAVEKLEVDKDTGLFYNWYDIKAPFAVRYPYLSSVDNFHLALAFWVLAHDHPLESMRYRAKRLFDRMDFSKFIHPESQLVRGGLSEDWIYRHYGTEARGLYAAGWPMGIYKRKQTAEEHGRMMQSLVFEIADLPTEGRTIESLSTWDGGAFQLLLPELLIGESSRSFRYKIFFDNYARYVESETKRRTLPVPAAHSASQFCVLTCEGVPSYNGKAGSLGLVSKYNNDVKDPYRNSMWEAVFTPHAGILSLLASTRILPLLLQAETITGMYDPRIGWSDGYWTGEPRRNEVVHTQLALDQQMIAMTLGRLVSDDNQSVSQRALNRQAEVKTELNLFYQATEAKLASK